MHKDIMSDAPKTFFLPAAQHDKDVTQAMPNDLDEVMDDALFNQIAFDDEEAAASDDVMMDPSKAI